MSKGRARVRATLLAAVVLMLSLCTALGANLAPANADTARPRTLFFLDGADGWTVVARVDGADVVGWIGIPEADASFCFRGTVTNGRLVGRSYNLIPETGEWVVGRLAVRAGGIGPRFTVTAVAVGTSPAGRWTWDTKLSKATVAQARARLGRGLATDLSTTPRACARMWTANAGNEPQLTYLPDDPQPEPAPPATPTAPATAALSITVRVSAPPDGEGFIEVANTGSVVIDGYQVRLSPFNATVSDYWNGLVTVSAAVATITHSRRSASSPPGTRASGSASCPVA